MAPMHLTTHLPFRLDRPVRRVAQSRRLASPTQLAKRAGGPQDRAYYTCGCGFAFTAAVSTSVGCPHCGTAQAW